MEKIIITHFGDTIASRYFLSNNLNSEVFNKLCQDWERVII
ncbi:hypothetical protein [Candidatus Cardinium hertigii]